MDEGRKWWDAATVASVVVVALLVWFNSPSGRLGFVGVLIVLAVFLAYYFAFGRRVRDGSPAAVAFQLVIVACLIAGAWFAPDFLTLQVIALPLIWTTAHSTRWALILNAVIAVGLTLTFALGLGGSADAFAQGATVEGLSLMFSIALGLWVTRVHEYGSERARLLAELTAAQGKLELLSRDAGASDERERIAREIHDTIAQSLTGLVLLAQRARQEEPGPALEDTLSLIETMARESLGEARALVATAAGIPEGADGLAGAIGRLGERFHRETGIKVDCSADPGVLARDAEVVLLRTTQEALANVRKHSDAAHVTVSISRAPGMVTLVVADDGRGLVDYDPHREQGFGIAGMRDRVQLVDGELELIDRIGGGAVLTARIPVQDAADAPLHDDRTPPIESVGTAPSAAPVRTGASESAAPRASRIPANTAVDLVPGVCHAPAKKAEGPPALAARISARVPDDDARGARAWESAS